MKSGPPGSVGAPLIKELREAAGYTQGELATIAGQPPCLTIAFIKAEHVSALETFKREVRIATSRRAQPVWFRILKWAIAICISAAFWRTPYFFWWIFGALGLSLTLHFFWRWKTKGWTQPWGGWDDL